MLQEVTYTARNLPVLTLLQDLFGLLKTQAHYIFVVCRVWKTGQTANCLLLDNVLPVMYQTVVKDSTDQDQDSKKWISERLETKTWVGIGSGHIYFVM